MDSLRSPLYACLLTVSMTCGLGQSRAQEDLSSEPYIVFVAQEGTHARCGPSGDYYRTDQLRHGQTLEVYAETEDGWLGVRPPDDSFCWVIADAIEVNATGDDGTIVEDRSVAWIGTHLGRARKYRWQVQMAKGESVSIIGKSEREGPDGPQLWYRIVPPSGEFRWVHRDQVVENSEDLIASNDVRDDDGEFLPDGPTRRPIPEKNLASNILETPDEIEQQPSSSRRRSPEPMAPSVLEKDISVVGSGLREGLRANATDSASTGMAQPSPAPTQFPAQPTTNQASANSIPANSIPAQANLQQPRPAPAYGVPRTLRETITDGLAASVQFLGGPRMQDIGTLPAAAPAANAAADSNWVVGGQRPPIAIAVSAPSAQGNGQTIQQVSAVQELPHGPNTPQGGTTPATLTPTAPPNLQPMATVSPERIAAIENETKGADVDRLSLVLSRLMASQASTAEAEPVAQAALQLSVTSNDPVIQGRAQLLAERVRQYQRVSGLREQNALTQVSAASGAAIPMTNGTASSVRPIVPSTVAQVGYLVQVYSARSNTPPYALTDNAGRTLVYVSPMPGVNFRVHLNSHVKVVGQQSFLRGLNTPHILATRAFRTPE